MKRKAKVAKQVRHHGRHGRFDEHQLLWLATIVVVLLSIWSTQLGVFKIGSILSSVKVAASR